MNNSKAQALQALTAAGYNARATKAGLEVSGNGWSALYSDMGQDYNVYTGKVPAEVESLAVWDEPATRRE